MSAPGSRDWWIETGLIAAGGLALAAWLWDGPIAERAELIEAAEQAQAAAEPSPSPPTLADMLQAGCLTSDHLQAMREGRDVVVLCPPPNPRPFP